MPTQNESPELQKLRDRLTELEQEKNLIFQEIARLESKVNECTTSDTQPTGTHKIDLFMRLFATRTDVYPKAWTSKDGKRGWSPVCTNEWKAGICNKKMIKCLNCPNKNYLPFDKKALLEHFRGHHFLGMYAIDSNAKAKFLAADFDEEDWLTDAILYRDVAKELSLPAYIERSRSGKGCHVWIFFDEKIPARTARELGFIILDRAVNSNTLGKFKSYDRFFPSQDTLPEAGFGNLIALPFCGQCRPQGNGVFINDDGSAIKDLWPFLFAIQPISEKVVTDIIIANRRESQNSLQSVPQVLFGTQEADSLGHFDGRVRATLANTLQINTQGLPAKMISGFKKLVTFANPVFFENERIRKSNWKTPRYIVRGEMQESTLILPRGVTDAAENIVLKMGGQWIFSDERPESKRLDFEIAFTCRLRAEQRDALAILIEKRSGILVAPTGTGKTVIGCALIALMQIPTLVLCHRKQIADQWQERLLEFTDLSKNKIGMLGGSRKKTTGAIDIVLFQSLASLSDSEAFLAQYSLFIVDECHHVPALSFEDLLSKIHGKHIFGFTATPKRKDGLHPIMEMQCGPIRHVISEPLHKKILTRRLVVCEIETSMASLSVDSDIHALWEVLVASEVRTAKIANDIATLLNAGRKILVLSERKDHLGVLFTAVKSKEMDWPLFEITGDLKTKSRKETFSLLEKQLALSGGCALFATGSLVGEGVDLPGLDTLVVAFPCSSKEKLTQYLGRIEREHAGKSTVIAIDYVDRNHPITLSMAKKRATTYRVLKYAKLNSIEEATLPTLW